MPAGFGDTSALEAFEDTSELSLSRLHSSNRSAHPAGPNPRRGKRVIMSWVGPVFKLFSCLVIGRIRIVKLKVSMFCLHMILISVAFLVQLCRLMLAYVA